MDKNNQGKVTNNSNSQSCKSLVCGRVLKSIALFVLVIIMAMSTVLLVSCDSTQTTEPPKQEQPDNGGDSGNQSGTDSDNTGDSDDTDNDNTDSDGNQGGDNTDGDNNGDSDGNDNNEGNESGDDGESEIQPEPVDDLTDLYMEQPNPADYTDGTQDKQYIADMQKYQSAQQMKKSIYQNLETHLKDKICYKLTLDNTKIFNEKWCLISEENNSVIDNIQIIFDYKDSDSANSFRIAEVGLKVKPTIEMLANSATNFDEIFTTNRTGATYGYTCTFGYNLSDQDNEFYNKLKTALIANGTLPKEDENTEIIIKCTNNATNHPTMGLSSDYKFLIITNYSVKDVYVTIDNDAFNDGVLSNNEFEINTSKIDVSYPDQWLDASVLSDNNSTATVA